MTNTILSFVWWKAAAVRGLRTALVIAVPYIPASYTGSVPYLTIALAASLGFVASLLTSLAGIGEATGTPVPVWYAITSRVVKSVAQAAVAFIGTAVLITDVNWADLAQISLTAGFGSLLLAVIGKLPESGLPESDPGGKHSENYVVSVSNPAA